MPYYSPGHLMEHEWNNPMVDRPPPTAPRIAMARIEHRSPIGRIGGERSSTLSRRVMGHLYYRRCVMDG